jgi:hypothetical protein
MNQNESKSPRAAWEDLSPDARRRVIIQAVIYVVLVVLAFRSLSRQSAANLRGPKQLWKGVIPASVTNLKAGSVVPIGPILYFAVGRRPRQAG